MRTPRIVAILATLALSIAVVPASSSPASARIDVLWTLGKTTTEFYPAHDGFQDIALFEVLVDSPAKLTLQVIDAGGSIISESLTTGDARLLLSWDGTGPNYVGTYFGTYTVKLTLTDTLGVAEQIYNQPIKAFPHRITQKHMDVRMNGKDTVARWAGKCSTFKSPSSHGWKKSLALNSLTKCKKKTWRKSGVVAVYEAAMPANVFMWQWMQVRCYSAAGKKKPRSLAYMESWNPSKGEWVRPRQLRSKARYYAYTTIDVKATLYNDRYFAWRVYTAMGARYDLGHFLIRAQYVVLQDPQTGETVLPRTVSRLITSRSPALRDAAPSAPTRAGLARWQTL